MAAVVGEKGIVSHGVDFGLLFFVVVLSFNNCPSFYKLIWALFFFLFVS